MRDRAPLDFQGFPPLPSSRTLDKKNGKPRSPASVGFLDKAKSPQKQQFACLAILSKNWLLWRTGQNEPFCPVRDRAPLDFPAFPVLPPSPTWDKTNGPHGTDTERKRRAPRRKGPKAHAASVTRGGSLGGLPPRPPCAAARWRLGFYTPDTTKGAAPTRVAPFLIQTTKPTRGRPDLCQTVNQKPPRPATAL